MSELAYSLTQPGDTAPHRATPRRAVVVAAALILLAAFISLTATTSTHAVGPLTITISNTGMTPTSATVGGGIVHLKIENSSSRETITLRINRENGQLVREVVLLGGTREIGVEVEMGAGQYVITDTSNTSWNCALTVQ